MTEKKYKPTRKKLRDARKRGEVVRSRELNSVGVFVALWLFLGFGGRYLGRHLGNIVETATVAADPVAGAGSVLWLPTTRTVAEELCWVLAPLLLLSVGSAILIGAVQTRGLISVTPIVPKFERINPANGLRNLFSTRQLFDVGKMLLKTALLIGASAYFMTLALPPLLGLIYGTAADMAPASGSLVWQLMGWAALIYAIGAALDYAHQFHEFMKRQKMSVQELRRDQRDREGDPLIKGRRRSIGRENASGDRLSAAGVVVVDPAHVSVALQYAQGRTPLPRVIVKGLEAMALKIRTEAERQGIPVLEDPSLARKLFNEVAVNQYISEELIDVVAAAFRWAKHVDRRPPQSASRSPK